MYNHVLDYLAETVARVPEKTAFVGENLSYTFRQVYDISRSIGSAVLSKGLNKEPVIVFMQKSPQTIVTFFGVVNAGCYYVPIDEEMPAARINLIFENCQSKLMICDNNTVKLAQELSFDGDILIFDNICDYKTDNKLLLNVRERAIDTDPIYIVFTSGSTGVPKGVCACHRSVIDYVEQLSSVLEFDENTIFGNQTPLYFDACLKELYPTLKFGATTYLIPHQLFMFPVKLVEYLNENKINTICWVVSALTMISTFNTFASVVPKYLRTIAFGSEVFPVKQLNIWRDAVKTASFFNLYGPTEGTGMCCYYPIDREFSADETIPIGYPFKNTDILLLDNEDRQVEDGEPGEICIRGTSVTLGYYNNPDKTKEAFVQNPLNKFYPEIIYRTGDIGKKNDRGELVFLSRKDYQIKHMGHRIELGEIEVNVNVLDEIKFSGCIYDSVKNKIVLFFVGDITAAELSKAIKERLPRYMMPNNIISLKNMPFTANGKIDRVELKKIYNEKYINKK